MTSTPPSDTEPSAQAPPQSPISGIPLPQYGYGSECSFDTLIQDNPFLFRVYTPKTRSQIFAKGDEPYFVGQKFNERFTRAAERLKDSSLTPGQSVASVCTYEDVSQHMDWTQRHMSPFISTTFSFVWAIWEATRRYRVGLKHDVEIAIIDARMLAGRAATALELLRKGSPTERHIDHWKWYRYALESQDVLVHGAIPAPAVLASVPLLSLIDRLPSYFLRKNCDLRSSQPSLDGLAWDTMDRKPSFRQFCQDMSDQFLQLSDKHRLRDTTGGSVRLAMAFLRPWFHKVVAKDFSQATDMACTLAFMIAQWPAQWWSRDHLEMWSVIRSLVQALAEEVREKQRGEVDEEVRRLRDDITDDYELISSVGSVKEKEDVLRNERVVLLPTPPLTPPPPSVPPSVIAIDCNYPVPTDQSIVSTPTQDVAPVRQPAEGSDNSPPTTVTVLSPTIIIHQQLRKEQRPAVEAHPKSPSPDHDIAKPKKMRSHSLLETASCVITGVLVGAFITFYIINAQRRTLIYVT